MPLIDFPTIFTSIAEDIDLDYIAGWETRSSLTKTFNPVGLCWHHTAGPRSGDAPSLNLCISKTLVQILVARSGRVHIISGNRSNHIGLGLRQVLDRTQAGLAPLGDARDAYGLLLGIGSISGNGYYIGIEIENDGLGEPYPAAQMRAVYAITTAIFKHYRWSASQLIAHKEWTSRKPDPAGISMPEARGILASLLAPPPPEPEIQEVPEMIPDPRDAGTASKPRAIRLDAESKQIIGYNGARLSGMREAFGVSYLRLPKKPVGWFVGEAGRVNVVYEDGSGARYEWE